ncbi:tape measure protein [Corynebacterium ureicelerivorans]
MADLATAYIQIIPTFKDLDKNIRTAFKGVEPEGEKSGQSVGKKFTDGFTAQLSKDPSFGKVGDKIAGMMGKTLKAGMVGAGVAAGGAMAGAFAKGFGRLNALDQAEAKLRGLKLGTEEVDRAMQGVNASVKGTAFGLDEAAGSAGKFIGANVKVGEELDRAMKLTADIAAQAGSGMDEISSILAKVSGAGRLTGETLAQLDDRAVGASAALSEHLGVSIEEVRDQVSKGEVDFETFSAAMEDRLGGAAQSTGETFKGAFDNMWAAMGRLGAKMLDPVFDAMPSIFGAVGQAFDDLGEKLEPVAQQFGDWLAPRMQDFAENVVPRVVDGLVGLVDKLISMGQWVQRNSEWLAPLAVALGTAAVYIGSFTAAVRLAEGAMAAFKAVTTAFAAANPFMLILTGVTALVAGLTYFFTQTETGRKAWASFTDALAAGWQRAQDFLAAGFEVVRLAFVALGDGITWVWGNVIKTTWDALAGAAQWLWSGVLQPVFGFIVAGWNALGSALQWVFNSVVKPVWDAFAWVANWLWSSVLQPVFGFISAGWQALGNGLRWVYDSIIQPVWNAFGAGLTWLHDNVVTPVTSWIGDKWSRMGDGFNVVKDFVVDTVFGGLQRGLESVQNWFTTIVDGIGRTWNGLRSLLAKPINFMINTVYNDGILRAWNVIAGILPGLEQGERLAGIPEYATGGRIKGPGTGTSDDILAWLSNGEHVWTAREVQAIGGHSVLDALRDAILHRRGFTFDGANATVLPGSVDNRVGDLAGAAPDLLPKFAQGGRVDDKNVRPLWELQLVKAHEFARAQHGKPYQWAGPTGPGSSFDCSGYMGAIAATIQGTNPWQRYWATMSFPSPGAQGFVPGLGAGFSVGIFNGGPYGGHTAGTLSAAGPYSAVNVESGGAPSMVKYGVGAAGADDPQFTMHYHLPIGADGGFVSGGNGIDPETMRSRIAETLNKAINVVMDPIKGQLPSPPPKWMGIPGAVFDAGQEGLVNFVDDGVKALGDGLGTVFTAVSNGAESLIDSGRDTVGAAMDFLGARVFDRGGVLRKGQMAVNLGNADEHVISEKSFQNFRIGVESLQAAADEIQAAFAGNDRGYAALAATLRNEQWAKAIVDGAAMLGKIADYNSLEGVAARSFASEMSGIAGLLGGETVSTVATSLLDAEKQFWDAREGYASRTADIAAKEKALADARKAASEAESAEDIAKANEQVVKAEQELAAARKASAQALDVRIFDVAPQINGMLLQAAAATAAVPQVSAALAGLAAVAGPAGITVGVAVASLKAGLTAFKEIAGAVDALVGRVGSARGAVWGALSDALGAVSEFQVLVRGLREDVTRLALDQALAQIELAAAYRNVRMVAMDGVRAQLEGVVSVAKAQAEFDASLRADMRAAMSEYDGLSAEFDRFRHNVFTTFDDTMSAQVAWSDQTWALWWELQAAQTGRLILEKQAQADLLEAQYKSTLAALDLVDVTRELEVAAQKLAVASSQAFGMDAVGATVGGRWADLQSEKASLRANNASVSTWLNPVNWFTTMPAARARMKQIDAELAELEARPEFQMDRRTQRQVDRAVRRAGLMGFLGAGDQVDLMMQNTGGDAARALDRIRFESELIDLKAQQKEFRSQVDRSQAELDYRKQADPLELALKALESEQAAQQTYAEMYRTENQGVRDALLALAKHQEDTAQNIEAMSRQRAEDAPAVALYGSSASMDDVQSMLEALGHRVDRMENPPASAAQVAASRR